MSERATLDELKDFANRVRAAGGGNPIDALIPAVPEDSSQCLIAKNLNFNCQVDTQRNHNDESVWVMKLKDKNLRDRIAKTLHLKHGDDSVDWIDNDSIEKCRYYSVVLPEGIGQVAADFDAVGCLMYSAEDVVYSIHNGSTRADAIGDYFTQDELKLFKELLPYIEAATEEAHELATIVNPDGSIVL